MYVVRMYVYNIMYIIYICVCVSLCVPQQRVGRLIRRLAYNQLGSIYILVVLKNSFGKVMRKNLSSVKSIYS